MRSVFRQSGKKEQRSKYASECKSRSRQIGCLCLGGTSCHQYACGFPWVGINSLTAQFMHRFMVVNETDHTCTAWQYLPRGVFKHAWRAQTCSASFWPLRLNHILRITLSCAHECILLSLAKYNAWFTSLCTTLAITSYSTHDSYISYSCLCPLSERTLSFYAWNSGQSNDTKRSSDLPS